MADELIERYRVGIRQACAALRLPRSVYYHRSTARDSTRLKARIGEIAATRVHYGYRRVHVLLRREGRSCQLRDNHKRVYRLYREQGVSLRHKRPKRNKAAKLRQPKTTAQHVNQMWSMDFVADNLFDGRKLRMLTVVDCFTRESLAIHVGQSLKGEDVVRVVDAIARERGTPQTIKTDNGSEFISKAMDRWAYERKVEIDFSRPGKPTDNAMVESFNGRLRQECLNEHWIMSLEDAQHKIEAWRRHRSYQHRESRPHAALDWRTPYEFALLHGLQPVQQGKQRAEIPNL